MCLGLASGYIKNNNNIKAVTRKEHLRECHPDTVNPIIFEEVGIEYKPMVFKDYLGIICETRDILKTKSIHIVANNYWEALRILQYEFQPPKYQIVKVIEL